MKADPANSVVMVLIFIIAIFPLIGTTIFPQYAALLWGLSIVLGLAALSIVIPRTAITQHRRLQSWLFILGALLLFSLAVLFLSATL
jgi:hypothetical protein